MLYVIWFHKGSPRHLSLFYHLQAHHRCPRLWSWCWAMLQHPPDIFLSSLPCEIPSFFEGLVAQEPAWILKHGETEQFQFLVADLTSDRLKSRCSQLGGSNPQNVSRIIKNSDEIQIGIIHCPKCPKCCHIALVGSHLKNDFWSQGNLRSLTYRESMQLGDRCVWPFEVVS